jgi:hypothetical protein
MDDIISELTTLNTLTLDVIAQVRRTRRAAREVGLRTAAAVPPSAPCWR